MDNKELPKVSPQVSPEQIMAHGIQRSRSLLLDKNVVAAFGVFFRLGVPTRAIKRMI
jgi:hypothetical protein